MRIQPRTRIFSAYAVVLALGAALALLVVHHGGELLSTTSQLVDHHLPRQHDIASLQLALRAQELNIHQYYTDQRRQRFDAAWRTYRGEFHTLLTRLQPAADDAGMDTLRPLYERLETATDAFAATLLARRVDWDSARVQLAHIRQRSAALHSQLDKLSIALAAGAEAGATDAAVAVQRTRRLVLTLSAAIFFISLLVGYHINAYIADQAERRRLAMFPERNPNPILRLSLTGELLYANPGATALLRSIGAANDTALSLLPDDLAGRLDKLRSATETHAVWEYPVGERILECGVHYLPDLECFHAYIADITERKRAQEDLVYQAYHDPLTGLSNRRRFHEELARTLHTPDRGGMRAAVLLLGLDRLNVIIGGLGHGIGDGLLQAVTARLEHVLEGNARLANQVSLFRFGGDEFALLVPGFASSELPIRIAETLIEAMREPVHVNTREFFLSFSIGISVFPLDGQDVVTLLRNADTAMNRARTLGGNTLQCYSADMNARAAEWLTLENHLRHAEEYGELRLHYQPQIDVRSGRLVGAEALLRWQHPERGLIPPADFIPLAEDTGIIVTIGEYVLRSACAQAKSWESAGLDHLVIAINISARQFHQQDLPRLIDQVLRDTRLPAHRLELEITEGVAMHDVARTTSILKHLKDMGVRLSIDDFGTGLSSLSYLKRFPIDKLKIDQSFVRNLARDENDAAITRAVITLGHSLKLSVIAEGVETDQQLSRLRADDCDEVQGFLFGRPMPAEAFERLWRNTAQMNAR